MSLRAAFPNSHMSDPASSEAIDKVEEKLGVKFPPALRALYLECDGFREPKGNVKYLLSLTNDDFIGSLIKTTQMHCVISLKRQCRMRKTKVYYCHYI